MGYCVGADATGCGGPGHSQLRAPFLSVASLVTLLAPDFLEFFTFLNYMITRVTPVTSAIALRAPTNAAEDAIRRKE